jgi:hypothetical protein
MSKSIAFAVAAAAALVITAAPAQAGDGTNLLSLAPENSQLVLVLDVADARDSTLLQKGFDKLLAMKPEAKTKLAELGLDPLKDIDTVMFAGSGSDGMEFDEMKSIIIVIEGRLPKEKLSTMKDAKKSTYAGVSIFTNNDTDAAFVGDRLFFAKKGQMKAAIDIALNKGKGKGKNVAASKKGKAMRDAIASTDTTADLWATILIPPKAQAEMKKEQGMIAKTVSVGFNFTADIAASLEIGADSEATATKMTETINASLAQVTQAAGTIGLSKAAKSLLVAQDKAQVNITFKLSEAEINALMGLAGMAGATGGSAPPSSTKP